LNWYLKFRQQWLSVAPFHKLVEVWFQNRRCLFVPSNYFAFLIEPRHKAKQAMAAQKWDGPRTVVKRDCQVSLFENWHAVIRITKRCSRDTGHSQTLTCLQNAFGWGRYLQNFPACLPSPFCRTAISTCSKRLLHLRVARIRHS
jgi:hypothetical protein